MHLRFSGVVVACVFLVLSVSAQAGVHVPGETGAFVKFCARNFKSCREEILQEQIVIMAAKAWANSTSDKCWVPDGVDDDTAARQILGWLKQHGETAMMKTEDGVETAVRGIWNCQTKIETGLTSMGVPDRTGAYMKFCGVAANYAKCANQMVADDVIIATRDPSSTAPAHCTAPKGMDSNTMAKAIYYWLYAHPETYELPTDDGVWTAIDALWPCH